jgi:hypothetical protein
MVSAQPDVAAISRMQAAAIIIFHFFIEFPSLKVFMLMDLFVSQLSSLWAASTDPRERLSLVHRAA